MCPEIGDSYKSLELRKSDEVAQLWEKWLITDTEVKLVVHHGETTGEKLYQPGSNRYLAKANISDVMYYVEYSPEDRHYVVHSAYAHRSRIVEGG